MVNSSSSLAISCATSPKTPGFSKSYKKFLATKRHKKHKEIALKNILCIMCLFVARGSVMNGWRVVFLLGNLELGGAERQALILARYLSEHERADVEVWGFNRSGPVADICEQHRIKWRVVSLKQPFDLRNFTRLLREARPDILLPYTLIPNVVCGLVWQRTGASLCVWNQRDEGIFTLNAKWQLRAAQQTPQFVSNSQSGARYLIEKLNVD